MNAFSIKDLENLSGIKAHTIRIWEQRYSFLRPRRTETNIRLYTNEELKMLLNIALLNKYGYKISQIDKMSAEEIRKKLLLLSQLQAQQERVVNKLIQLMVDLDTENLEEELNSYIATRGIERTIAQIIFPFMEKIGLLWHTNQICPAHEHLVTNIVRQKIIVGIENCVTHLSVNKTVILFLPEEHYHELGLLYLHFLLKNRGVRTVYLGVSVQLSDLEYIVKQKSPAYIYCHLTAVAANFNFERFLQSLSKVIPDIPVIISGPVTRNYRKEIPANISFMKTLQEVTAFVATL